MQPSWGRALSDAAISSKVVSRRQLVQVSRAFATDRTHSPQIGSTGTYRGSVEGGYSAADDPELRKNPELYQALTDDGAPGLPVTIPTISITNPAKDLPQAGAVQDDGPAVSYLMNPAISKANTTTSKHTHPLQSDAADNTTSAAPTTAAAGARGLIKPEILAPVGGWPQMRAAVENGADAVYFGLSDFNARARASNFEPEELTEVMTYLHDRGVKGFVTMNVLVFDEELPLVEQRIRQMAQAGVDAVIVQDLGVVELIRRVAPGLPVHGSTQMSITSAEGASFAGDMGVERVVVGRELSIKEIAKVSSHSAPEVEAFVHGALCVSYSGQCFSSEAWGGRSANRGQCAQACRMPYGLMVDGMIKELADVQYLLSPQDLSAVEHVPELILAGVSCFKIEGRLKGPEYVSLTTQLYRKAVDSAWDILTGKTKPNSTAAKTSKATSAAAGSKHSKSAHDASADKADNGASKAVTAAGIPLQSVGVDVTTFTAAKEAVTLTEQQRWDLEQVFARGQDGDHRGLTPGFLEGVVHQRLVRGRAPRHRGVYAGKVLRVSQLAGSSSNNGPRSRAPGNSRSGSASSAPSQGQTVVTIELAAPLKRGDGLVFDAGKPEATEEGGSIYDLLTSQGKPIPGGSISPSQASDDHVDDGPSTSRPRSGSDRGQRSRPGQRGASRSAQHDDRDVHAGPIQVAVVFGHGQVNPKRVRPGDLVWRTKDYSLESRLIASFESVPASEMRKETVHVAVRGTIGEPLAVVMTDGQGREAVGVSTAVLGKAEKRSLTHDEVCKAVGAVGGDGFKLEGEVDTAQLDLGAGLFLPVSEMKATRRAAAEALTNLRRLHGRDTGLVQEPVLPSILHSIQDRKPASHTAQDSHDPESQDGDDSSEGSATAGKASKGSRDSIVQAGRQSMLRVLCRSEAQVRAALEVPWLEEVVVDFLEVQGLKEAVEAVRASGKRVGVATPRILKPDEERLVHFYLRLRPDVLLIRSTGLLHQLVKLGGPGATLDGLTDKSGQPLTIPQLEGDFSLNAANAVSADLLLQSGQLSKLAPTHDLSAHQICTLAKQFDAGVAGSNFEVILHHHLPIFHTEHCVFARFLSDGNSYKDCGHPCEKHTVHLRDEKGHDHLMLADMGCRNTLFNAAAQSGVFYVTDLLRAGLRHFRVELVDQPAHVVAPLLQGYRDVLDGQRSPGDLWSWLRTLPDANGRSHGVTAGSLGALAAQERDKSTMKPTAASLKQKQRA